MCASNSLNCHHHHELPHERLNKPPHGAPLQAPTPSASPSLYTERLSQPPPECYNTKRFNMPSALACSSTKRLATLRHQAPRHAPTPSAPPRSDTKRPATLRHQAPHHGPAPSSPPWLAAAAVAGGGDAGAAATTGAAGADYAVAGCAAAAAACVAVLTAEAAAADLDSSTSCLPGVSTDPQRIWLA